MKHKRGREKEDTYRRENSGIVNSGKKKNV
jgi:hypothetical protein